MPTKSKFIANGNPNTMLDFFGIDPDVASSEDLAVAQDLAASVQAARHRIVTHDAAYSGMDPAAIARIEQMLVHAH